MLSTGPGSFSCCPSRTGTFGARQPGYCGTCPGCSPVKEPMLRVFLTIVLPLLLPTAVYLLWIGTLGSSPEGGAIPWTAVPWIWLAGAGAVLLAVVLLFV